MKNAKVVLPDGLQEPQRVRFIRRLIGLGLLVVALACVGIWLLTRETLPAKIRLTTALPGGLYHKLGTLLEAPLEKQAERTVEILETNGTLENQRLLREGKADVAFLQGGAGNLDGLIAIAPLYYDVVHVIVRPNRGLKSLLDLHGKKVAIGLQGSGMRESALDVLEHYEISTTGTSSQYFTKLRDDPELDAAIATTGLINPDLNHLLETEELHILPLLDAPAMALLHPHFTSFTIPRGLFSERPPVPAEDVETLATTNYVAVRADASGLLVDTVLQALYQNDLRHDLPTFIPRGEAAQWDSLPLHPSAQRFFRPYGGLEVLANFMESLAALKELLFALGAGLYLTWLRWQRVKEQAQLEALQIGKDRLDVFLEKTIEIEKQVLEIHDIDQLRQALRQITDLKHQALKELTHESLRGDVSFTIFLQQCGDVIRRIQNKLRLLRQGVSFATSNQDDTSSQDDASSQDNAS